MKNTALAPVTQISDLEPILKDKDGDDGDNGLSQVIIDIALNGYCVTFFYEDASEMKQVFTDFDDMIKAIRGEH